MKNLFILKMVWKRNLLQLLGSVANSFQDNPARLAKNSAVDENKFGPIVKLTFFSLNQN
jgi:hypothetical protein